MVFLPDLIQTFQKQFKISRKIYNGSVMKWGPLKNVRAALVELKPNTKKNLIFLKAIN